MSTSFLLTAVTFQPVTTALSDIFGRKPTLYLCCALFTIGLIIFGTAKSPTTVILGRTIQGVGGGGLEVLSEVILTDITTLKERPLYLGIMSLFWAGAAVAGPPIGGALAEYLSWRWLAWILLPLMGLSLVLIPPFLSLQQDTGSAIQKAKRVDWMGIALFICACTLTLFPITAGGQLFPWQSFKVWLPFSFGIVCLAAFCWVEYKAFEPMLPLRIFKSATVSSAMFGACLHGIVVWCILYFVPIYFQAVHGRSAVESGIDGFSFGFTATPAAIIAALLIEFSRRYLWSIAGGWLLGTAGTAALTILSVSTNMIPARAILIPSGIGFGMLYPGLAMPIQAGTSVHDVGIATGTLVFFRNLGSTLGIAVSSAIFTNRFSSLFVQRGLDYLDFGIGNANDALGLVPHLHNSEQFGQPAYKLLQGIYADSFRSVIIFTAVVSAIGLITTVFIKELAFEDENLGKQRLRGSESVIELVPRNLEEQ